MISYSPFSTMLLRAHDRVTPRFSTGTVEAIIEDGSTSAQIDDDAEVILHNSATVDFNSQIVSDSFEPSVYTTLNPEIASVDARGYVTRLSDGTAEIICKTGTNRQKLKVNVYREDPADVIRFSSWVTGTMARFISETVTSVVSGVNASDSSRRLFEGAGRNPFLFAQKFVGSLTAIAKAANGSSHIGFTAITPRHVVSCWHSNQNLAVGHSLPFLAADSTSEIRYTTHAYRVGSSDVIVYLLDADLPETITPMALMPSTIRNYIRNPQFKVPLLFVDRDNMLNLACSNYITEGSTGIQPPEAPLSYFYTHPVSGTSGKPVMIPVSDTELALLTTFTSPDSGPSYHSKDWASIIPVVDALANISTGYLPRAADLSAFPSF